ncbi:outer membrane lipid asymmetry maintenance protein MlaD [Niveispirillum sp. BGYR6]|uniref:outer membrane lipid asymmetry maintenance protein MlaD n=1 Tax=Niveispirillum sp. BGYR6 TaxID=2971249 RepID=UPI0022B99C4A|nr:outer membrane lipid asymmetry maintenance protein MlaD [Niveispirillum sp. BGYR6]MDG5495255.1 outer membrane lipid asymmetry maintenance protein MlaD [Niveispirillum sp. BGYR6]
MRRNVIETVLGAVVLVVAGFFLFFAYTSSSVRAVGGYKLEARFSSTGGLSAGSDVRISGVKVGTVTSQFLDKQTFQAVVQMEIDRNIQLPRDTSAVIASESLLGGRYLQLDPGGEEEKLKEGDLIEYTQSAVNLEDLLGRFMFNSGGSGSKAGSGGNAETPPAAANQGAPAPAPGGLLGGK